MANNYTVSNSTTLESVGDSVANGTIPSSSTLIITPLTNFVLQASDFFIGSALPAEVTSVSFADTGTALDPANTIIATVTLASWYVMPSSGTAISVDIDGRTHRFTPKLNFTVIYKTLVTNVTTALTVAAVTSPATKGVSNASSSEVLGDSITTATCFTHILPNKKTNTLRIGFTAADTFHFETAPSYSLSSTDSSKWSSVVSSTALNSANQLTSIVYDFYYNMGSEEVTSSFGESVAWSIPTPIADKVFAQSISSAYYEYYKNESILPAYDKSLSLNVIGKEKSTYNIKIEDTNGLTYDFSSDTFTRAFTNSSEQVIQETSPTVDHRQILGGNTHTVIIPAYLKESAYGYSFTTTITPTGVTKTNIAGDSTTPHIITLRQFGEVDYVLGITANDDGTVTSDTTVTSVLNKIPLTNLDSFVPGLFPERSTHNNGYFTYSSALAYTVTDTVDDSGGFSGTTMTMDTSYVTKKVVVGDTVTGTNIATDTTIAAVNVGDDPLVYTLSKSPSGTVADGATITFTRTVGISRQPLITDISNHTPGSGSLNSLEDSAYVVSEVFSNSNLITLAGTENESTGIAVGMLVLGDNIVGYPLVSAISGEGITLSSSQILSAGDLLYFSSGGKQVDIESINVTGAGTSSCKLNITGLVKRMGIIDITDVLLLNNFTTAYVAPTIVAATATCPLGGSVTIEPLSGCTSHTGILTIEAVAVAGSDRGATNAIISGDKKSILYAAPSSGTSETVTYTISDGVSATTGTANIVITLTP